jgi:TonB-dependent receptor
LEKTIKQDSNEGEIMTFQRKAVLGIFAVTSAHMLALSSPCVYAQEAAPAAEPAAIVTVSGFKRSYSDALQMKRQNIAVTDSISSEGLDRFPDLNVGEALQRIPGIQVNREEDSRNASINLRGLPSSYAKTTLNGMDFAVPALSGATPLGAYNSDIFSAFTVQKSVSAADQTGGISGNIDMQIQSALSRKEGASIKIGDEYDSLGKYNAPRVTLSGAKKYMDNTLGVFGVLAWKDEKFRRDSVIIPQYTAINTTTTPGYASRFGSYAGGVMVPSDIRQAVKYNEGNTTSGAFGAEYKLNSDWRFGGTYFFTNRDMPKTATDILDIDMRDAKTIIDPTSTPFQHTDGKYYATNYNFTNPRVFGSFRSEPFKEAAHGLNLTSSFNNDNWRIDGALSSSRATSFAYQSQIDVRDTAKAITAANPNGNGITGTFGIGSSVSDYRFLFNQGTPALTGTQTTGPWTYGGTGPSVTNANGDVFIVAGSDGRAENASNTLKLDAERFLDWGWLDSVQAGAQYNKQTYESSGYRASAAGIDYSKINSGFIQQSNFASSFFGGNAGNYQSNWQTVNYGAVVGALQPVTVLPGQRVTYTGWVNDPADGTFTSNNFSTDDRIKAAYLMGKFKGAVGTVKVRGNVGVRQEDTDETIQSLDRTGTGTTATFQWNTKKHTYSNTLPSMLVAADLTDKFVVRYGAYKTFVRPNPRDMSPLTTTVVRDDANGAFNVSLGRVDIQPYKSTSQDLSFEFYNRPNGLIGLALYRKSITGLIAAETRNSVLCPADGYGLGLGNWSVVGDRCVSDLPATGSQALNGKYTVNVTGSVNSPNAVIVNGAELTIQQAFDFLPAPFNKTGGVFNYSYTRTSGKTVNGSNAVLTGVSPRAYNAILYYETDKWGMRAVYNYRNDYVLPDGGTFSGAARSVKARGQLDLSASYNLTKDLTLSLDAFNLTDSFREEYEGSTMKPRRADYDGRTFVATMRYTFF